jgi:hypothetical protein
MRRKALAAMLVAAMIPAVPQPIHAQGPAADLAAGIRQAQSGEFDAAAITLEGVVGRSGSALSAHDRGRAYTYLSVAYHGLAQTEKAKQRLLQALQADPALTLDPKEFPPKIMDFFGQTLKEAGRPMPTPRPSPSAASAAPAKGHGGGGKTALIVVGLGAAAAGVALAAGGGGSDSPTTTTPAPPNIAGTWVGDGANGQFFTAGPCVGQNEVTLRITQSGGTLSGTSSFKVVRQGGAEGCSSSSLGMTFNGNLAGTVTVNNDVTFTFPGLNGETWRGTVQGNRMSGTVEGLPAGTQSTWTVLRQ